MKLFKILIFCFVSTFSFAQTLPTVWGNTRLYARSPNGDTTGFITVGQLPFSSSAAIASGTAGYLSKYTSSTTIGNSAIYESGGNVTFRNASNGYMEYYDPLSTTLTGYMNWRLGNGTLLGSIGNSATDMKYTAANGATHVFSGGVINNSGNRVTNIGGATSGGDALTLTQFNNGVSGTANYLAKFTGTNVVSNSSITDDGSRLTTALNFNAGKHVAAQGIFQGYSGAGIFLSYETYGGRLESYDYGTSSWKDIAIAPNGGKVNIGMTGGTYGFNLGSATTANFNGAATFSSTAAFLGATSFTNVNASNHVAARGTFQGYSGAGIFMSYETYGGRIESYDYGVGAYKDIAIANTGGNVNIGMTGGTYKFNVLGISNFNSAVNATNFISNVATGTSPIAVSSTTLNTNLNADLLDNQHGSYYQNASNLNAGAVADARLSSNVPLLNAANTFTSVQTASKWQTTTTGSLGYATINGGDGTGGGYLELYRPNNQRAGYIGYATNTGAIQYTAENSSYHNFSGGIVQMNNTYTNTSDGTAVLSSTIPILNLRTTAGFGRFSIATKYLNNNVTSFLVGTGTTNPTTNSFSLDHTTGALMVNAGTDDASGAKLQVNGAVNSTSTVTGTRFISNVANGTQPYQTTSTTLNANLNANYVQGLDSAAIGQRTQKNSWTQQNSFAGTTNFTGGIVNLSAALRSDYSDGGDNLVYGNTNNDLKYTSYQSILNRTQANDTFAMTTASHVFTLSTNQVNTVDIGVYTNVLDSLDIRLASGFYDDNQVISITTDKSLIAGQGDKIKVTNSSGVTQLEIVNDVTSSLTATYETNTTSFGKLSMQIQYSKKRAKWRIISFKLWDNL